MSIFGRQNLPVLGAMLSDVGVNLRGGQSGALAALQAKRDEDERQTAAQKWRAGLFGNGVPTREALGQAILNAPDGANINQAATAFDLMTPQQKAAMQAINVGNGTTGIFNPETGSLEYQSAPNPLAALEMKKLEAEIAAIEALKTQRTSSAGYSDAKARQPYAPRAGSSAASKPPPGFILD